MDSLALGDECRLDPSRVEDARLGFASLELLNDTPDERDVRFPFMSSDFHLSDDNYLQSALLMRAYYAYAMGRYKECVALLNPMNFDENTSATNSNSGSSALLNVPSSSGGSSQGTGSAGTHLTWTGSIASVDVDGATSKMWRMVEIIRGRCLQGQRIDFY